MIPSAIRDPAVIVLRRGGARLDSHRASPRPAARGSRRPRPPPARGLDRVAARLRARPLLDEQKLAALVVLTRTAQTKNDLPGNRHLAVDVLVQAVVSACLVGEKERVGRR